ncbi:hypothetical protein DUI87_16172 [Hirundo rustica rustica]|uniref:Uncharacterized protein n=1 Tax=Hirundo rustica rustica TaxID=333673 RepID=A0A3M0K168_HIRRU|nr:hypothetical protein DUI87_16172 [Hirundo rustica rustica]
MLLMEPRTGSAQQHLILVEISDSKENCNSIRKVPGALKTVHYFLMRGEGGAGTDLFSVVNSDRISGDDLKLHQGKFRLHFRERFFTQRVAGHYNRLPRKVVTAPNLTEFRKSVDNALRHMMGLLGMVLCRAGQELD